MASKVTSNAKEFTKSVDKAANKYNLDVMRGMASMADNALVLARRNILDTPARGVVRSEKTGRFVRSKKTYDAYKLTNRTGLLRSALDAGRWRFSKNLSKPIAGNIVNAWIRPQKSGSSFIYLMNLGLMPRGIGAIEMRLRHEDGRGNDKFGRPRKKRPFFTPGVHEAFKGMDSEMFDKLKGSINQTI
jgi:hypothetical protein